jgi:hypothetical protein
MNCLFRVHSSEHRGREKVEWKVETVQVEFYVLLREGGQCGSVGTICECIRESGTPPEGFIFLSPLYAFHPSRLADAPSF